LIRLILGVFMFSNTVLAALECTDRGKMWPKSDRVSGRGDSRLQLAPC
jgi:hypothetical protein